MLEDHKWLVVEEEQNLEDFHLDFVDLNFPPKYLMMPSELQDFVVLGIYKERGKKD